MKGASDNGTRDGPIFECPELTHRADATSRVHRAQALFREIFHESEVGTDELALALNVRHEHTA